MTDFTLICPHCGGAISHSCGANIQETAGANPNVSGANPGVNGANSGANSRIAQMVLGSTKDGRQPYNQGYSEDFELFWKHYPLHRDKRKALKAWRNSVRRLAQSSGAIEADAMAQILEGAIRYRDDPNRQDEFTKYAEGWLNGDGWEDDPLPARNGKGPEVRPYDRTDYAAFTETGA